MLIVFEGVDASGKQTQTEILYNTLKEKVPNVSKITFPDYDSPSSALVKMYLGGMFGSDPSDVSAYAASAFYAVDRYASFKTDWGKKLESGEIVIADRYVTSNMIHQAAKIDDKDEKLKFLDWVYDFEYIKLGLPQPDKVFFLDMPPEFSKKLIAERDNKITGRKQKDIHENNSDYLYSAYKNAVFVATQCRWDRIYCVKNDKIRNIEDIKNEILSKLDF